MNETDGSVLSDTAAPARRGRYVRGGSLNLSKALATAIERAGGEILLGQSATAIRLDSDGRPTSVVHVSQNGGEPMEARASIVVSNAAPAVLAPHVARADAPKILVGLRRTPPFNLTVLGHVRAVGASRSGRRARLLDVPTASMDEDHV